MSSVSPEDLLRTLKKGKQPDRLGQNINKALLLIQGVLDDLGEDAVGISFNGGKDCTVLLHLYAAVLYARYNTTSPDLQPKHNSISIPSSPPSHKNSSPHASATPINSPLRSPPPLPPTSTTQSPHHCQHTPQLYPPISSIYITAPNPFPTLETFVQTSASHYNLDLDRFGGGMKAALSTYLSGKGKNVKAILVGTRRGDPNGDVEELAPTDPSWPAFLRVHPILDWTYADVWEFLRELNVPWCPLYDEGFTSLGSTTNTVPNPLLRREDGGWNPAWMLEDATQERAGRLDGTA